MPPASQPIEFEGYFAERMLDIFKIIRGFADLRDLAAVLVPFNLSDGAETMPTFHLDEAKHFIWTSVYLANGRNG